MQSQLLATRAALVAAIASLDVLLEQEAIAPPSECTHPRRKDVSTMGNRRWMCEDCGHIEGGE